MNDSQLGYIQQRLKENLNHIEEKKAETKNKQQTEREEARRRAIENLKCPHCLVREGEISATAVLRCEECQMQRDHIMIGKQQHPDFKKELEGAFNAGKIEGYIKREREIKARLPEPGKTAVTLYIPEEMTLGDVLSEVYKNKMETPQPSGYSLNQMIKNITSESVEQIQEAIDKLSP